jgi:hypothetical protein
MLHNCHSISPQTCRNQIYQPYQYLLPKDSELQTSIRERRGLSVPRDQRFARSPTSLTDRQDATVVRPDSPDDERVDIAMVCAQRALGNRQPRRSRGRST